jgi:tetratricopeptide (TPR) repeat protein
MSKIERNSLCPCGSGLKYKKCCINKEKPEESLSKVSVDNILEKLMNFMSYDEINEMSTAEIISKLEGMGIPFNQVQFLKDIENYNSAEQVSKHWYKTYNVTAVERDKDFPWFSAWILWERLAPKHILPIEHINDLIQKGYEYLDQRNSIQACDIWLEAWNALKYRIKQADKKVDDLEQKFLGNFYSISNLLQDLEMELHNSAIDNSDYYDKRITYCREICNYFSDEDESFLHDFRRAIAESLFESDHIDEAKEEFNRLIRDYPDNIWSYIAYGDAYWLTTNKKVIDKVKAKELYEKALLVTKDKNDIDTIMERIDDLDD